jgi:hypothetical protein
MKMLKSAFVRQTPYKRQPREKENGVGDNLRARLMMQQ